MSTDSPIAQVSHITVAYGERTVLHDVSASFEPSRISVILGTSGCGKTTLLKTMLGLLRPRSGAVEMFGTPLRDQDDDDTVAALKRAGVLFQNGALLGSLTVEENVALPLTMHTSLDPALIREIAQVKLGQVGLPHVGHLYPSELSGGMRKRAALARALALEPPLLLCDEPSAGLDPVTSAGLDGLLLNLRRTLGITIIVVTHELLSIEKIADSILFLHEGSVLYAGPPAPARQLRDGPIADFFARREPSAAPASVAPTDLIVESVL